MKSINRFIYGPSPEEKVREWQRKLRQEERSLEREVVHVSYRGLWMILGLLFGWRMGRADSQRKMDVVVMVDRTCEAGGADMQLDRASQKSRMDLKQLAKKGDVKSARILARELVRANKQRDRLISSQARVKSVQMQLQHQLCTLAFFHC